MPFFSCIIPSYNRADMIAATIDSVLAQEFADVEIIVVDDGSTDATMDVLARYGDRIQIHRQPNKGPGAARNLGISRATGQYLAFLDSDDLWFPWTLATYKQAIDTHSKPAAVVSLPTEFSDPATLAAARPKPPEFRSHADFFSSSRAWFLPSGWTVRADVMRQVGGFAQADCEDCDIWLRLGTARGFVEVLSPKLFGYRQHAAGIAKRWQYRVNGVLRLIEQEKQGAYPGGPERRRQRIDYICQHARPTSLFCLKLGLLTEGRKLYRRSFPWHLRLGRVRYLTAFPLIAAATQFRKRSPADASPR